MTEFGLFFVADGIPLKQLAKKEFWLFLNSQLITHLFFSLRYVHFFKSKFIEWYNLLTKLNCNIFLKCIYL